MKALNPNQAQIIKNVQSRIIYINDNSRLREYFLTEPIEIEEPTKKGIPYIPLFKTGNKMLQYVGIYHTKNPENEAIKVIEEKLKSFKPDFVLFEGMQNFNDFEDSLRKRVKKRIENLGWDEWRQKCIQLDGENLYTMYHCLAKGIECKSIEPTKKQVTDFLLEKGYSKDEILFNMCLHILVDFNRIENDNHTQNEHNFIRLLQARLDDYKENVTWDNYNYSYSQFQKLYKSFTDKEFDIKDKETYQKYRSHELSGDDKDINYFTQMNIDYCYCRDTEAVKKIYLALQKYNKVMVVMGLKHSVLQQPGIRAIFEKIK